MAILKSISLSLLVGIEAQGKMVEQVDLDDKKEDKASNEVEDDVTKVAMEGV